MEYSRKLEMFYLDFLGTDHFDVLFKNFSLCVLVYFVYYENKQKQNTKILKKWSIFKSVWTNSIFIIKIYTPYYKFWFINNIFFEWRKLILYHSHLISKFLSIQLHLLLLLCCILWEALYNK